MYMPYVAIVYHEKYSIESFPAAQPEWGKGNDDASVLMVVGVVVVVAVVVVAVVVVVVVACIIGAGNWYWHNC